MAAPEAIRRRSSGGTILVSAGDGAWIGGCSGAVYAVIIALWSSLGQSPSLSGSLGVGVLAGLVAVPVGVVLGAALGLVFGTVAVATVSYRVWVEVLSVALFGCAVLGLALAGAGGKAGVVAWTAGPLVVGTPAAALHGVRLRRRLTSR